MSALLRTNNPLSKLISGHTTHYISGIVQCGIPVKRKDPCLSVSDHSAKSLTRNSLQNCANTFTSVSAERSYAGPLVSKKISDVVNSLKNEIRELIIILNEEVELNKTIDGIENILEILLSNEEVLGRDYCRRVVSRLYNTTLKSNSTPSTFFAKLITSMIVANRLEAAIHFAKLFNIPSMAFTGSLHFLSEKKSLELIENLANLIEKVYYHDLKPKRRRKSYESEPELGGQKQIVTPDSFFYLARIWKRESILDNHLLPPQNYDYKGKKSMKRHTINVHQLRVLSNELINIWSREMEECLDITSSLKILCYAERNEIQLDQIVVDRCRRTYIETGTNKLELEEKLARINIAPNI